MKLTCDRIVGGRRATQVDSSIDLGMLIEGAIVPHCSTPHCLQQCGLATNMSHMCSRVLSDENQKSASASLEAANEQVISMLIVLIQLDTALPSQRAAVGRGMRRSYQIHMSSRQGPLPSLSVQRWSQSTTPTTRIIPSFGRCPATAIMHWTPHNNQARFAPS